MGALFWEETWGYYFGRKRGENVIIATCFHYVNSLESGRAHREGNIPWFLPPPPQIKHCNACTAGGF